MRRWPDRRQFYYDSDDRKLYPETVFGAASVVISMAAIFVNIDDPNVLFLFFAIALGIIGIVLAVITIISSIVNRRFRGVPFAGFAIAMSLFGIILSVVIFKKFGL